MFVKCHGASRWLGSETICGLPCSPCVQSHLLPIESQAFNERSREGPYMRELRIGRFTGSSKSLTGPRAKLGESSPDIAATLNSGRSLTSLTLPSRQPCFLPWLPELRSVLDFTDPPWQAALLLALAPQPTPLPPVIPVNELPDIYNSRPSLPPRNRGGIHPLPSSRHSRLRSGIHPRWGGAARAEALLSMPRVPRGV